MVTVNIGSVRSTVYTEASEHITNWGMSFYDLYFISVHVAHFPEID